MRSVRAVAAEGAIGGAEAPLVTDAFGTRWLESVVGKRRRRGANSVTFAVETGSTGRRVIGDR